MPGRFQLLSPVPGSDTSEEDDHLVVDDRRKKSRKQQAMFGLPSVDESVGHQGAGPLRLKLSG